MFLTRPTKSDISTTYIYSNEGSRSMLRPALQRAQIRTHWHVTVRFNLAFVTQGLFYNLITGFCGLLNNFKDELLEWWIPRRLGGEALSGKDVIFTNFHKIASAEGKVGARFNMSRDWIKGSAVKNDELEYILPWRSIIHGLYRWCFFLRRLFS